MRPAAAFQTRRLLRVSQCRCPARTAFSLSSCRQPTNAAPCRGLVPSCPSPDAAVEWAAAFALKVPFAESAPAAQQVMKDEGRRWHCDRSNFTPPQGAASAALRGPAVAALVDELVDTIADELIAEL